MLNSQQLSSAAFTSSEIQKLERCMPHSADAAVASAAGMKYTNKLTQS